MFCIMRFFLLYLATIVTAITGPFADLLLDASSFASSASQGSDPDIPEIGLEGTSVSPANSHLNRLDRPLLSLANSGSVTGSQFPNTDIQAPDPGTEKTQGDLATHWYLRPFLWMPHCETLFPSKKPFCCEETCCDGEVEKRDHTVNGCEHWINSVNDSNDDTCLDPRSVYCCGSWDWVSRIAYGCLSAFYDDDGNLRMTGI